MFVARAVWWMSDLRPRTWNYLGSSEVLMKMMNPMTLERSSSTGTNLKKSLCSKARRWEWKVCLLGTTLLCGNLLERVYWYC